MNKTCLIILAIFLIISQISASSSRNTIQKSLTQSKKSKNQLLFCIYPSCRTTSQWVSNGKQATYNGCSAGIFKGAGSDYGWTSCCNQHDLCWGSCTKSQTTCDNSFKSCMYSKCDNKYKKWYQIGSKIKCKATAFVWYLAVKANFCRYIEVQKSMCKCQ